MVQPGRRLPRRRSGAGAGSLLDGDPVAAAVSREHFQRTLELNRDYWPAQYNLAIVYTAMGRPDDAIPKLRIVLDWRPDFHEARYLLAVSLDRVGLRAEAEEEFARLGEERSSLEAFDQLVPLPAIN